MKKISAEFQDRLNSGATKLCRAWRVERMDGKVFGFTDHDEDILFDGIRFSASSGLESGALQMSTGLSVNNSMIVGALQSTVISEEDIRGGRFDDAKVCQWMVDWERPHLREILFSGTFGEIKRHDGCFEVELRSIAEKLNTPVGRSIKRKCDCDLGDEKCGFNLKKPGFSFETQVAPGSQGPDIVIENPEGGENGWFEKGTIKWLSGKNFGRIYVIRSDISLGVNRTITLWQEPLLQYKIGDRFILSSGCDKTAKMCAEKFKNIINFRGFPHIPGDDWVIAYPKDGDINDGGKQHNW